MTDLDAADGAGADGDAAELQRLGQVLARLTPALEAFQRYEDVDRAVVDAEAWRSVLDRPPPREGAGLDVVVEELAVAAGHGCRIGAPGFVGFITTSGTTSAVAAALTNAVSGGQRYLLHAFNGLEWIGLRWLAEACRLPAEWPGVFTSGGSTANLLALAAARQWAYEQHGVDVGEHGLPADRTGRIYVSSEAHRTIHRSAAVLGLGRCAVREIPVDGRQRIDLAALEDALVEDRRQGVLPVAVVGVAGTTNTGAIDPLEDVVALARRFQTWAHVDGAYGLLAAADTELQPVLAAVREADSAIVDPHKWLATGLGVGAAYVRDAGVLHRALMEGHAPYLEGSFSSELSHAGSQFDAMGGPWADLSVELSAPPRGVAVWAVLREIGLDGLAARVRRHCGYAQHVAARALAHPRLELLTEPELSICCFRYRPGGGADEVLDALNARILQRLRHETPHVPTSTVVAGRLAIRPCYVNPRTTLAEVDGLVDEVIRLGDAEVG